MEWVSRLWFATLFLVSSCSYRWDRMISWLLTMRLVVQNITWKVGCDQWPLALQPQQPQQPWGLQKWGHSAQKATFGCRGGAGGAAYASPAMNQFRSISVRVSTCQLRYPEIAKLILTVSLVSLTVRILCSWLWSHVAINSAARWNVDSWTLRCSKV